MQRFVVLDKNVGETPLVAIEKWRAEHPAYAKLPISYAGRLDPMASGKLLAILGDECKNQKKYIQLDKEYEIEVLFDIGTDSGDALGICSYARKETTLRNHDLTHVLRQEYGKHSRAYPAFSSKTVAGKPLFLHALEGTLSHIDIPEHTEHIYRIKECDIITVSSEELRERISHFLDKVPRTSEPSKRPGEDFRVDTVRRHWEELFSSTPERTFTLLRLRVTCGSGVYMRALAGRIGESMYTKALALSIKRTKIGTYLPLFRDIGFWLHTY